MEVRREIVVPAARDDVWAALTDARRLGEWFANDVELALEPGGEGVFRWRDGSARKAVVEDVEPGRRFSFRWYAEDVTEEEATTVTLTLDDAPGGTQVVVVETAPALRASAATAAGEWSWALELLAFLWEAVRLTLA